jgi:hypothetical protein
MRVLKGGLKEPDFWAIMVTRKTIVDFGTGTKIQGAGALYITVVLPKSVGYATKMKNQRSVETRHANGLA